MPPNHDLKRPFSPIAVGLGIILIQHLHAKKWSSLSLLLLCSVVLFGQTTSIKNRIKSVKRGLITYLPVQGFPAWNIYKRMKHYKVPRVSIAVVYNFKVEWAKGYGLTDTLKKRRLRPKPCFPRVSSVS